MTAKDYFIHWIGSFLGFDQTMTLDDRQVQEIREQLQLVYDEEKVENRKHIPLPNPQKYVKDDRDPYKTTDPNLRKAGQSNEETDGHHFRNNRTRRQPPCRLANRQGIPRHWSGETVQYGLHRENQASSPIRDFRSGSGGYHRRTQHCQYTFEIRSCR